MGIVVKRAARSGWLDEGALRGVSADLDQPTTGMT